VTFRCDGWVGAAAVDADASVDNDPYTAPDAVGTVSAMMRRFHSGRNPALILLLLMLSLLMMTTTMMMMMTMTMTMIAVMKVNAAGADKIQSANAGVYSPCVERLWLLLRAVV
jgi:hypothetical protein